MSNGKSKTLNLRPAHEALGKLLQEVETVQLPRRPGTTIEEPGAWVESLKATHKVLFEWCDGFMLEVQSKR